MSRAATQPTPGVLVRLRSADERIDPPPGDAPRRFHQTMPGYAPTPLRRAPSVARARGLGEVLVKDESARLGLPAFKILGASWALCRAIAARLDHDVETFERLARVLDELRPLTLCAATDGNHGRAVARLACLLRLDAKIFMPEGTAPSRIAAISGEGAQVSVVDGGYEAAVERAAREESERCIVIADTTHRGHEPTATWVIDGYSTMLLEIEEQLARSKVDRPDLIVVPVGVGALAAAVVRHFWSTEGTRPRILAVEPTSAACLLESVAAGEPVALGHPQTSIMAGLNCGTPSLAAWPAVSRGIDAYLAAGEQQVPIAMRQLARDGIVAGETGAAAVGGLLELTGEQWEAERLELGLDQRTRALLFCTEGVTDPDAQGPLMAA
jgi:diaminopropionate ammonia-lyase